MRTAKTLIRLGGCPGWSESSLGALVILLVLSCAGSNYELSHDKICLSHMETTKMQMSLCICAVYSAPFVIYCLYSIMNIWHSKTVASWSVWVSPGCTGLSAGMTWLKDKLLTIIYSMYDSKLVHFEKSWHRRQNQWTIKYGSNSTRNSTRGITVGQ